MFRFIVLLIVFGSLAVLALLYFDLIALTPAGQGLVDDAGELIGDALDGNGAATE